MSVSAPRSEASMSNKLIAYWRVLTSVGALALGLACSAAGAADAVPPGATVKKAVGLDASGKDTSYINAYRSRIRVSVDIPPDAKVDLQKLVPYLDEHPFKGIYPVMINTKDTESVLEFVLPDKQSARNDWRPILQGPPFGGTRRVRISVGPDDGRVWPPADYKNAPALDMVLFPGTWWLLAAGIVGVGIALCVLAAKSCILRDGTPKPEGKLPPFSLAKTQAAVWFFLVFAALVFIWLMTTDYNGVRTTNTLALIGNGSGTTLGAAMVEAARSDQWRKEREDLQRQLDKETAKLMASPNNPVIHQNIADLEQKIRPASRGLIQDLLTDVNGITLHRFQMLLWTVSLGLVFIVGVYQKLAMPEFDATLLALMGISSGVYLGFKIPEKQT